MSASRAQRATAAKKRAEAIKLKIEGLDWDTIAERVGYRSRGAACTAVGEALRIHQAEQDTAATELITLTVLRYDRLQAAFWPQALDGDVKAAEIVLKCLAGRAKIEGTDAPRKIEHAGDITTYEVVGIDPDELT